MRKGEFDIFKSEFDFGDFKDSDPIKLELPSKEIVYLKGRVDINKAREPLYTSRPDLERSGMGFTVMESFMDSLEVESKKGKGTRIVMTKKFS